MQNLMQKLKQQKPRKPTITDLSGEPLEIMRKMRFEAENVKENLALRPSWLTTTKLSN